MHVLLTGVTSFIGRNLVRHLLLAGHIVTATYRTRDSRLDRLLAVVGGNLELVSLDLRTSGAFAALPKRIDAVVHVAALSAMPGVEPDELIACNAVGTCNTVTYALAANAKRFIYASSLSVHGRIDAPVVDENTPTVDPGLYGATKYLGERLISELGDRLPAVSIRLPGVLGEGAHRAWIPTLLERIRSGQHVTIYNPDSPFNNAVHTDDIGRFVVTLLQQNLKRFSAMPVGAAGTMLIRDVPKLMMDLIGRRTEVVVCPPRQPSFVISSERAIRDHGYVPTDIQDMLRRYVGESRPS